MASSSNTSENNKICCFCNSNSLIEMDMGEIKSGVRFKAHYYCLVKITIAFLICFYIKQKKQRSEKKK